METHHIFPEDYPESKENELSINDKLIIAVSIGNIEEVKKLLTVGESGIKADVNYGEETNNVTALMTAVANDQIEAVKVLIQHGADVNNPTRAVNAESLNVSGAKNFAEPQTYPLHRAVMEHNLSMVELLVANGASPHVLNGNIEYPLDLVKENLKTYTHLYVDSNIKACLEKACAANPMDPTVLEKMKENKRERMKNYCIDPLLNAHKEVEQKNEKENMINASSNDRNIKTVERISRNSLTIFKKRLQKDEEEEKFLSFSQPIKRSKFDIKKDEDSNKKNNNVSLPEIHKYKK